MAIKRAGKKNMKIIAATSMVLFSLFAAFSGVVAWFTSIHNVNNQANGFIVIHDESTITTGDVYCIKYDGLNGATATKLREGNYDLVMSEYDSIFTDRNINTPLFLRIPVKNYNRNKDLTIVVPCFGDYKTGSNTTINNYLSNVVCVKFSYGLLDNKGTESTADDEIVKDPYELTQNQYVGNEDSVVKVITLYERMRDRVASLSGTPFVTNASTGAKNSTISLMIPKNTIPQSYIENVDGGTVIVYLEFDYYVTNSVNLVKNYINSYPAGTANRVFNSDILTMKLKDSD